MRVTRGDASASSSRRATRTRPRHNTLLQVGLLLLAGALGFVVHQQGWHRPLGGFVVSLARHPAATLAALFGHSDLPTLRLDMRFRDYQQLLDRRAQALLLGANRVSEQDYVPAGIGLGDETIAVQVRLPAGPATSLGTGAWPFEVAVQDGTLWGLRRFTLTPADATMLSTWGYLETLRRAGLFTPRHQAVRLVLNGTPHGVYMLEELPTADTLAVQGHAGSVVVAFEQDAYWEAYARIGAALPGSGFQYARIVCAPYDDNPDTACSDIARALYTIRPDEWDAERTGTFLAITTLWRGSAVLDWRTLRLAYDPRSGRLAPIGTGTTLIPVAPLPDVLLDDPRVQVAYVRALAQFSTPDYLAQLQADIGHELESLGIESGYLDPPWTALSAHQTTMRRMLALSHPLLAYIEPDDTALVLHLSNVQQFPVEVVGLDLGESALLPLDPAWVSETDRSSLVEAPDAAEHIVLRAAVGSMPRSIHLRVPPEALLAGREWVWQTPGAIRIVARPCGLAEADISVPVYHDDLAAETEGVP